MISNENERFGWSGFLSLFLIIAIIFVAGTVQAQTDRYLQSQTSKDHQQKQTLKVLATAALADRVERYRTAFVVRDYETMYHLSYFKGIPKPTLIEYKNLRDPQVSYKIQVNTLDVQVEDDRGTATMQLTIEHPVLGVNKSVHIQHWQLLNDQWYRIDYGN